MRELCKEMMENEDYKKAKDIYERETLIRRKRVEDHELCKIPAGRGKWNGTCFRKVKMEYQKYKCAYGCGSMIRTYCICDRALMLCNECYSLHKAEHI